MRKHKYKLRRRQKFLRRKSQSHHDIMDGGSVPRKKVHPRSNGELYLRRGIPHPAMRNRIVRCDQ